MSVQAMARVWELDLPHSERLVLLALADHADHVGDNIYPSIGLIAWKTGYSSRQVQRIIKSLVDMEILCVVDQPEGRTTVYRMDLTAGTIKEPYLRQNVTPDKTSPLTKRPPKPRQNVTPTPDIAMSPKPSVKPSVTISDDVSARLEAMTFDDGQIRTIINAAAARGGFTLADCDVCERWLDIQRPNWAGKYGTLYNRLKIGKLPVLPRTNGHNTPPEQPILTMEEVNRRTAAARDANPELAAMLEDFKKEQAQYAANTR